MSSESISKKVKEEVNLIVDQFNRSVLIDSGRRYVVRIKGIFLYLDRDDFGTTGQICRLKYTGEMNRWEFAIYKYSSGRYDQNEWFFPGEHLVDGTIEGAMKAGLEAYD
ncbi:MAG: hypothetical protein J7L69_00295 [Desulfobulbaceae bacterium]|nr:hypothetical protein [Desulfobulbaceae bacterium]